MVYHKAWTRLLPPVTHSTKQSIGHYDVVDRNNFNLIYLLLEVNSILLLFY